MSTNATIKVEGVQYAKVYKHWDGNPESTLKWLEDFNKTFTENRGDDPEYKLAQLLRNSEKDGDKYKLDRNEYTGWGIVSYKSYTGDYEYILNKDGTVTIKDGYEL